MTHKINGVNAMKKQQQPRPYVYPDETKEQLDWAELRTLHLSDFDSPDPSVRQALQDDFERAVYEDGFLYIVDHGLSQEQVSDILRPQHGLA